MKIVADSKIPFLAGVFEQQGINVIYKDVISKNDVEDADALIVRTRTRCDESLLKNSSVKFVATATIGFDHIDTEYLSNNGIGFSSSSGCNARAVAQWVLASLSAMKIKPCTLGVIGVGNVGKQVVEMATKRGWNVLKNDPPRAEAEGHAEFVSLDELLIKCDVVTIHVPANESTSKLASKEFFSKFQGKVFLNSSRPIVVDETALMTSIDNGSLTNVALDVWEDEPYINKELLYKVEVSTPHIAGYSKRGKVRATEMAVRAIADYFKIDILKEWTSKEECQIEEPENYNVMVDSISLKKYPDSFEQLRNTYCYR